MVEHELLFIDMSEIQLALMGGEILSDETEQHTGRASRVVQLRIGGRVETHRFHGATLFGAGLGGLPAAHRAVTAIQEATVAFHRNLVAVERVIRGEVD